MIIIFAKKPLVRFRDTGMISVPVEIKIGTGVSLETGCNGAKSLFLQFRKRMVLGERKRVVNS